MNVKKDPSIKPNAFVAQQPSVPPDEPTGGQSTKSEKTDKDKAAAPSQKQKSAPPKRTIEKQAPEPGKLTAGNDIRGSNHHYRYKLET